MKHFCIYAILLCLLPLAELSITLPVEGLDLQVTEIRSDDEAIQVALSCNSESTTVQKVILLAPALNGGQALFDNGWGTLEMDLKPGEKRTEEIAIMPVEPCDAPESASFRYVAQRIISAPVVLSCTRGEWQVDPQGISQSLAQAGAVLTAPADRPIPLRDQISPEEAKVLDAGWALICLRRRDGANLSYMPFCRLPVSVDAEGTATATFSGLAAICSAAPNFPLFAEESGNSDAGMWTVSGITLSGEAVFFADLSLELHCDAANTLDIAALTVDSPELGGPCTNCPLGLFDEAAVYLPAHTFNDANGWTEAIETTGEAIALPLDRPLTFDLCSAFELGEVCVYYEYWFSDGSTTIHPPKDL